MAYLDQRSNTVYLLIEHMEWDALKDTLSHDLKLILGDPAFGSLGVSFIFSPFHKEYITTTLVSSGIQIIPRE